MKRLPFLFLLLFFLYHVIGYHAWFSVSAYLHKKKVEAVIKSTMPLEQLCFSHAEVRELIFLDGGKEVKFGGKMYDIRETRAVNGMLVITCIEDSKEKEMLREMSAFMDDSDSSPVNKHKHNFKDLVKYVDPATGLAFFSFCAELKGRHPETSPSSPVNEMFIPPPEANLS